MAAQHYLDHNYSHLPTAVHRLPSKGGHKTKDEQQTREGGEARYLKSHKLNQNGYGHFGKHPQRPETMRRSSMTQDAP